MKRTAWITFLLMFAGLALACSSSSTRDDGGGVEDGVDGAGDEGGDPGGGEVCTPRDFTISQKTARVMILLDQSSSMSSFDPWPPGGNRWDQVADGLAHLLSDARNQAHFFGLDAFPDGDLAYLEACYDECCADPVCMLTKPMECQALQMQCDRSCSVDLAPIVPLAPAGNAGPQIATYLGHEYLPTVFGLTPLVDQLRYYAADRSAEMPDLYTGDGSSYLLLISDGVDDCFDQNDPPDIPGTAAELGAVTREIRDTRGIKTLVIGFSEETGGIADELNAIAAVGGTSHTTFFAITEVGDLRSALDDVSAEIASCIFDVDDPAAAADPGRVRIRFDGVLVEYQETCIDGWHWTDASTPQNPQLEFCGPACNSIKAGTVTAIQPRAECAGP